MNGDRLDDIMPVTVEGASIPNSIADAILKVQAGLGVLAKTETNPFAHFEYVSIDTYYKIVAAAATEAGLSWFCKEVNALIVTINGKDIFKFTYCFSLFHSDGHVVPMCDVITIYHQSQGAQTSGSAASYAEKLFMRKLFKVVTGEKDADATDSGAFETKMSPIDEAVVALGVKEYEKSQTSASTIQDGDEVVAIPEPSPEKPEEARTSTTVAPGTGNVVDLPVPTPAAPEVVIKDGIMEVGEETHWPSVADAFILFLPDCKTVEGLKDFWKNNSGVLERFKTEDEALYDTVVKAFQEAQGKMK